MINYIIHMMKFELRDFIINTLKFSLALVCIAVVLIAVAWICFWLAGNLEGKMRGPDYRMEDFKNAKREK